MNNPQWRDPRPEDHGKYAFIQSLPSDAPPCLLRRYFPFLARGADDFAWQYWTTAGWVDLTSRVCVCERPA